MEIGNARIEYLGHSGFLITLGKKKIAIDPYAIKIEDKADMILITHSHYDHCSIVDIEKLSKQGTIIVVPPDAQSKITKIKNIEMQVVEIGEQIGYGKMKISAVPAYNIGKVFHPKKEGWLGYIISFGSLVVYHAGDTDKIPEMSNLSGYGKSGNIFVCLLPVSGKYVMDYYEAAEAAELLGASFAVPMHFGAGIAGTIEDAQAFVSECKKRKINAQVLEKREK